MINVDIATFNGSESKCNLSTNKVSVCNLRMVYQSWLWETNEIVVKKFGSVAENISDATVSNLAGVDDGFWWGWPPR